MEMENKERGTKARLGVWCVCFLLAGWVPAFQSHVVAGSDARERANSPRSSARRSCFGRNLPLLWISIRKGTGPTDSTYPSRGRQLDGVFGNPRSGSTESICNKVLYNSWTHGTFAQGKGPCRSSRCGCHSTSVPPKLQRNQASEALAWAASSAFHASVLCAFLCTLFSNHRVWYSLRRPALTTWRFLMFLK